MVDTRMKNANWLVSDDGVHSRTIQHAQLAVLMDIRDELQALNRVMQCSNVARGFRALSKIAARDERAFKRRVARAVEKRLKRRRA